MKKTQLYIFSGLCEPVFSPQNFIQKQQMQIFLENMASAAYRFVIQTETLEMSCLISLSKLVGSVINKCGNVDLGPLLDENRWVITFILECVYP